jgi:manganese-dependent inorganic pyrophosphatase
VQPIYVTGHRNPDTDSIAAAVGYAELKGRLDPDNEYIPVRLGDCNVQTNWALKRSRVEAPEYLPHIQLRASDVLTTDFPIVDEEAPIREAGLAIARANLDLVPVVDGSGKLVGVVTERALARRYIRESRQTSTLREAPTHIASIIRVLEGELITGEDRLLSGRVWVHAMAVSASSGISDGDVVVIGDRTDAQLLAIDLGASLIVTSNGARPTDEVIERHWTPMSRRGWSRWRRRAEPSWRRGRSPSRSTTSSTTSLNPSRKSTTGPRSRSTTRAARSAC